ncbi:hypothetical protein [Aeromonas media]|nr:hypothetical protein [Aeromonas media]
MMLLADRHDVISQPGDYINIPAHLQHRVEWTHPTETTVWLCIYY